MLAARSGIGNGEDGISCERSLHTQSPVLKIRKSPRPEWITDALSHKIVRWIKITGDEWVIQRATGRRRIWSSRRRSEIYARGGLWPGTEHSTTGVGRIDESVSAADHCLLP